MDEQARCSASPFAVKKEEEAQGICGPLHARPQGQSFCLCLPQARHTCDLM